MIGIVTRADLFGLAPAGMRQALYRWFSIDALVPPCVADHMKTCVRTITANALMSSLVSMFVSVSYHHIPVLDANGRLADVITESGLMSGLYR